MADNSEIILSQVLKDQNEAVAPETSAPDFFEIFCAEQATKDCELSYEEIQAGIVDGEHDGGIDSFFTFVNGECVGEEISFALPKTPFENGYVLGCAMRRSRSAPMLRWIMASDTSMSFS